MPTRGKASRRCTSTRSCSTRMRSSSLRARPARERSCSAPTCRSRSATSSRRSSSIRRMWTSRRRRPCSAAPPRACSACAPIAGAGPDMALELKGEQALPVGQKELWRLLNDPEVLAKTIPGCNAVRAVGEDKYEMGLKLQVANVSGEYMGSVAITEKREPEHYVLAVEGQGSIGFMKGSAAFDLEPRGH